VTVHLVLCGKGSETLFCGIPVLCGCVCGGCVCTPLSLPSIQDLPVYYRTSVLGGGVEYLPTVAPCTGESPFLCVDQPLRLARWLN